jgi:hypothetical protein
MQEPGSAGLIEASPPAGGLIRGDILLRVRTRVALYRSVLHNSDALHLLSVNDHALSNALLLRDSGKQ